MKVGLFLNTQFPEGDNLAARMPELAAQVRLARQSGFASLWFPDHYLIGPVQMPQPMPLMAWLLREAEGMTIGPNIRILPLLNPVMVAVPPSAAALSRPAARRSTSRRRWRRRSGARRASAMPG